MFHWFPDFLPSVTVECPKILVPCFPSLSSSKGVNITWFTLSPKDDLIILSLGPKKHWACLLFITLLLNIRVCLKKSGNKKKHWLINIFPIKLPSPTPHRSHSILKKVQGALWLWQSRSPWASHSLRDAAESCRKKNRMWRLWQNIWQWEIYLQNGCLEQENIEKSIKWWFNNAENQSLMSFRCVFSSVSLELMHVNAIKLHTPILPSILGLLGCWVSQTNKSSSRRFGCPSRPHWSRCSLAWGHGTQCSTHDNTCGKKGWSAAPAPVFQHLQPQRKFQWKT